MGCPRGCGVTMTISNEWETLDLVEESRELASLRVRFTAFARTILARRPNVQVVSIWAFNATPWPATTPQFQTYLDPVDRLPGPHRCGIGRAICQLCGGRIFCADSIDSRARGRLTRDGLYGEPKPIYALRRVEAETRWLKQTHPTRVPVEPLPPQVLPILDRIGAGDESAERVLVDALIVHGHSLGRYLSHLHHPDDGDAVAEAERLRCWNPDVGVAT